jgi:hypothetical protein
VFVGKYKIKITYKNYNFEEVLQINAESLEKAKQKCQQIKDENKEIIEKFKNKNIYVSKQISDCICEADWREELINSLNIKLKLD